MRLLRKCQISMRRNKATFALICGLMIFFLLILPAMLFCVIALIKRPEYKEGFSEILIDPKFWSENGSNLAIFPLLFFAVSGIFFIDASSLTDRALLHETQENVALLEGLSDEANPANVDVEQLVQDHQHQLEEHLRVDPMRAFELLQLIVEGRVLFSSIEQFEKVIWGIFDSLQSCQIDFKQTNAMLDALIQAETKAVCQADTNTEEETGLKPTSLFNLSLLKLLESKQLPEDQIEITSHFVNKSSAQPVPHNLQTLWCCRTILHEKEHNKQAKVTVVEDDRVVAAAATDIDVVDEHTPLIPH